eukprot:gene9584-11352_t
MEEETGNGDDEGDDEGETAVIDEEDEDDREEAADEKEWMALSEAVKGTEKKFAGPAWCPKRPAERAPVIRQPAMPRESVVFSSGWDAIALGGWDTEDDRAEPASDGALDATEANLRPSLSMGDVSPVSPFKDSARGFGESDDDDCDQALPHARRTRRLSMPGGEREAYDGYDTALWEEVTGVSGGQRGLDENMEGTGVSGGQRGLGATIEEEGSPQLGPLLELKMSQLEQVIPSAAWGIRRGPPEQRARATRAGFGNRLGSAPVIYWGQIMRSRIQEQGQKKLETAKLKLKRQNFNELETPMLPLIPGAQEYQSEEAERLRALDARRRQLSVISLDFHPRRTPAQTTAGFAELRVRPYPHGVIRHW